MYKTIFILFVLSYNFDLVSHNGDLGESTFWDSKSFYLLGQNYLKKDTGQDYNIWYT